MCELKTMYLLGAGFTRAVMGDAALLNDEIMDSFDSNDFPCFKDEFEAAKPNIEHFLTLVDLKCQRCKHDDKIENDEINNTQKLLNYEIVKMFDINRLSIPSLEKSSVLDEFIRSVSDGSYIILLNYDCVLDQGLWFSGRWDPADGYRLGPTPEEQDRETKLFLLKVHGSCSFRSPETEDSYALVMRNDKYFPGINNLHINEYENRKTITMSFIKRYPKSLMGLWDIAITEISSADKLVIIGCSLREEDAFLRFALYHFGWTAINNGFPAIDIVGKGEKDVEAIKSKLHDFMRLRCLQDVNLFSDGLESYLRTQNK